VSSAINAQIAILREEWELQIRKAFPHLRWKTSILERLNELVDIGSPEIDAGEEIFRVCMVLLREQRELAKLPLLPTQAEQWLKNKVRPKWERLLGTSGLWEKHRQEVLALLDDLSRAFSLGTDPALSEALRHLPRELRERWVRVAYVQFTPEKADFLNEVLDFLEHPQLPIPFKEQLRKALKSLKVLVDVIPEVEERANRIILSLRYGTMDGDPAVSSPFGSTYCIHAPTPSTGKGTSFVE